MKVICGSGAVNHLPVASLQLCAQMPSLKPFALIWIECTLGKLEGVFSAHLQESLHSRAAVLGSSSIIAVRQQHHQARLTQPFRLPTREKLIKNHLSSIGKVAKLSLPNDQGIWVD